MVKNSHPNKNSRNSSFELLRLVLMLMIVVHHCLVHGLGLKGLDPSSNTQILINDSMMIPDMIMNAFCICAVNCFILISGFFGIKVTKDRVFTLIFTLIFYTILLNILPFLLIGNWKVALYNCLFLSQSPYWFVIDYLFLLAFAPLINLAFQTFSQRSLLRFVFALIIISCYFGYIWNHNVNTNGYTLIQFITLYSIGRIIRISRFFNSKPHLSIYLSI